MLSDDIEMNERYFAYSASFFLAFAPTYLYANSSFLDLRFNYAQSTFMNNSNYVKVAFNRLATSASGSLTNVGQYVSYMKPTATMIARSVIPRLLLAASGVGTIAMVGYGIFELWKFMESKGYSFDSLSNSINFGGSKVADISSLDKLDENFLNDVNSYYSGGFSVQAYGQTGSNATIFEGTNALSVCNQFLNSINLYNSNFHGSNCQFSAISGSLGPNHKALPFSFNFVETGVSNPKPQVHTGVISVYISSNIHDVKEDAAGVKVTTSQLADHISNSEIKPGGGTSFISDFFTANPAAHADLIQNVFNPSYEGSKENIEEAKKNARPAYAGEVAEVAPPGSLTESDQVTSIPNSDVTTKNPDGTISQVLPAFCAWAPTVCQAADSFLSTVDPDDEKIPEVKHEITVSDRLNVVAQCPAPLSINVIGNTFDIKYDFLCSFAEQIRPLVLSAGYVGSAFLVLRRI